MRLYATVLLLFLRPPAAAEESWARFRGPNGAGVSPSPAPTQWGEGDYRWAASLPGEGHSSPVVFGERVYITSTDPATARQWLLSLSAVDGSGLWRFPLDSKPYPQHRFNSFASATPAADQRHVYVPVSSSEHYQIVAVTHEGKEAWRYDLGPYSGHHGSAASPIVYNGTVIFPNDQDGESFVIALGAEDGEPRWKTPRRSGNAAYGTPCVYTGPDGRDQLILVSQASGVTGLDPATGGVLWELSDLFKDRTVFSPVVAGDLVIAGAGQGPGGKKLVAVRPGSFDGSRGAEVVYEVDKALPYVPTPLHYQGLLFLLADGGILTCITAADGAVKWRERIGGDYFASPVCAAGVLYCVSRDGRVVTLKAADKFEPIARMSLGEPTHATPAAVGGSLFFRTERRLLQLGD